MKQLRICGYCLQEIRSHGEKVFSSPDYSGETCTCEWCNEEDEELYLVRFGKVNKK